MAEKTAFRKTSNTGAFDDCTAQSTKQRLMWQTTADEEQSPVGGEFEIDFTTNGILPFTKHFVQ